MNLDPKYVSRQRDELRVLALDSNLSALTIGSNQEFSIIKVSLHQRYTLYVLVRN